MKERKRTGVTEIYRSMNRQDKIKSRQRQRLINGQRQIQMLQQKYRYKQKLNFKIMRFINDVQVRFSKLFPDQVFSSSLQFSSREENKSFDLTYDTSEILLETEQRKTFIYVNLGYSPDVSRNEFIVLYCHRSNLSKVL